MTPAVDELDRATRFRHLESALQSTLCSEVARSTCARGSSLGGKRLQRLLPGAGKCDRGSLSMQHAIACPSPPDAPVTSAKFVLSDQTQRPSHRATVGEFRRSAEGGEVGGRADVDGFRAAAIRLTRPNEKPYQPRVDKSSDVVRAHIIHAVRASERSRSLGRRSEIGSRPAL